MLNFLRTEFKDPSLILECHPHWSSQIENHRELIHAEIKSLEKSLGIQSGSISHCPTLGGFVASTQKRRLGFDIEESSRITKDVLSRMFSQDEIAAAPHPYLLWCAKEALFKALKGEGQPVVLSNLPELRWSAVTEHSNTYQIQVKNLNEKNFSSLVGYVWMDSTNSLCVFSDSI